MERYKINRIGILNYWLYDEEEFYFYDGKLLLRGTNGAGKSLTMVSFFPLLFDGNKNPERLDTFGSRDRKIEEYILPSTFDGNENTSYLYMEFYNKEENKYLTLGIGLRAIRNRNVEFYGFAITDNRRIKQDFMLYKDSLRKIPLTKRELQSEIGSGGIFVTSAKEYKNMVNNLLFGFETEGLYTELINLMLQLRSPKLSKDYKPTRLEEILSSVLEPLSETDIATLSESIENMNKYKEKINDLSLETNAASNLVRNFQDYSDMILYHKAKVYKEALQNFDLAKEKEKKEQETIKGLSETLEQERKRSTQIKLELSETNYKINNLDAKDLNKLLEEKLSIENDQKALLEKVKIKTDNLDMKESKIHELEGKIKQSENSLYEQEKEFTRKYEDLNDIKEELYDDEIVFYLGELKEQKENFKFTYLLKELETKKAELNELLKNVIEKESLIIKKDGEEERLAKLENDIKEIEKTKKDLSENLLIIISYLKERIASFHNNKVYRLSTEIEENIIKLIDTLDPSKTYQIESYFLSEYQELKSSIEKEITYLKQKITNEDEAIKSLEKEKNEVSNILERNLEFDETKKYLEEHNVQVKYLYEIIEFKENVPENIREKLEKALKRMGILQTFLVKEINNQVDLKTFANLKPVEDSILKYFHITDKDYEKEAIKVLDSISTSIGNIKIDLEGNYELGIIKGQIKGNYELKYIGENTRKNYFDSLYSNIEKLILNHQNEIEMMNEKIKSAEKDCIILKEEYENKLDLEGYTTILSSIKDLDLKIEVINTNKKEMEEIINALLRQITQISSIIDTEKKYYKGPITSDGLKEVLNNFDEAKEISLNLSSLLRSYQDKLEILLTIKNTLEETNNDLDELNSEIEQVNFDIEKNNRKIKQITEQISSDEYKNIKTELETLNKKKNDLEKEKEENIKNNATHEKELEISKINLTNFQKEVEEKEIICRVVEKVFYDEYNLKYSHHLEELEDFNKWFKTFKIAKELRPSEASEKLLESMSNYLPKLQNYAGRKVNILTYDEEEALKYTSTGDLKEKVKSILNDAKRIDIEFRYSGKILNLMQLNEALNLELNTTKSLLNEEDRKLFEDLLMNNIGDSIRKKIASSNAWIKEVKNLMESMNTSSGLTFSIRWIGRGRETESELDTKEIVDIFERDPETLKEEDLQKITNHFRSKIALEEEKYEENERNYLEIIRNVLDYRKWYEFKLYFQRANTDKKELTDKEFSKFSGGEKAIAMYIPLFAGIYAKYNSARATAPRVIALDEAFAGVDDDNIKDCFRIMGEMDLDYVMTSQVLWGDYSSVKKLAICELHHLPSTNVVSVLRYKWDGLKRNLITSNKEYEA